MKKLALILVAVLLLTVCAACVACERAAITELGEVTNTVDNGDTPANVPADIFENTETSEITAVPHNNGDGLVIPARWVTERGTYFVSRLDGDCDCDLDMWGHLCDSPMLLHMTDSATGNTFVLCNRPECPHDSANCNAYLPADVFEILETGQSADGGRGFRSYGRSEALLFTDDSHIYATNGHNTIYRFNLDGTGRIEVMQIAEIYQPSSISAQLGTERIRGWLMGGKLYLPVGMTVPAEGSYEFGHAMALIEVDYYDGKTREIWRDEYRPWGGFGSELTSVEILGLWGGMVFLREMYSPAATANAPDEFTIFSIDPSDGGQETIRSGNRDNGGISAPFLGRGEATRVRTDGALARFSLLTGEDTVLAENLPTELIAYREINGYMLFYRYHPELEAILARGDEPPLDWVYMFPNDLLFLNIETGELIKSQLTTEILRETSEYIYIVIEREWQAENTGTSVVHRQTRNLVGRVSKADFWANNADAVTELDWEDCL
jgi:hypothetical protein